MLIDHIKWSELDWLDFSLYLSHSFDGFQTCSVLFSRAPSLSLSFSSVQYSPYPDPSHTERHLNHNKAFDPQMQKSRYIFMRSRCMNYDLVAPRALSNRRMRLYVRGKRTGIIQPCCTRPPKRTHRSLSLSLCPALHRMRGIASFFSFSNSIIILLNEYAI